MINIPAEISKRLGLHIRNVEATLGLLDEGATIPFISRYRKECTGSLNEVQIRDIEALYQRLQELEKRKEYILSTIESAGALTPELKNQIEGTTDANTLEDLYLPYKPKRRTRATIAREKGLEPLAKMLMAQTSADIHKAAKRFVKDDIQSTDEALEGASDIIAEWISENSGARAWLRDKMLKNATITAKFAKGKEDEADKYRNYQDYCRPIGKCPSHQYLALRRGQREGLLKVTVSFRDDQNLNFLKKKFIKADSPKDSAEIIEDAVEDSYKRLLAPSIENEVAALWKEKADAEAIHLFADNLRQLLLSPPLTRKRVMGIDPGIRTGCKVVCLDEQGNLLCHDVIYPHRERIASSLKISKLIDNYEIDAIALGNGTASRDTEQFLRVIHYPREVRVNVVNESGASVYSASDVAREEFPDHDVTVRGAVSIGRRLIDPLAELVKIDPKSIGVGQYQHDVDQGELKNSLDYTVMSCVNLVGVNVNTASKQLLSYISGIGDALASNIIEYRTQNGPFSSRKELMNVPRLGAKAFQQAAGFLRIPNAAYPLDNSAVHPESYGIVEKIAKDEGLEVSALISNEAALNEIDIHKYITDAVGLPTLTDIITELKRPGRDPREGSENIEFDAAITEIEDLKQGMELNGIVTNITAFGAFVNIGLHENGLVHISQMPNSSGGTARLKINQHIRVQVLDVDLRRRRIALTMKGISQGK